MLLWILRVLFVISYSVQYIYLPTNDYILVAMMFSIA